MDMGCCYSEFHALCDHQTTQLSDDRITRETLSNNNPCPSSPSSTIYIYIYIYFLFIYFFPDKCGLVCQNGGTPLEKCDSCKCAPGFSGPTCGKSGKDCMDVIKKEDRIIVINFFHHWS